MFNFNKKAKKRKGKYKKANSDINLITFLKTKSEFTIKKEPKKRYIRKFVLNTQQLTRKNFKLKLQNYFRTKFLVSSKKRTKKRFLLKTLSKSKIIKKPTLWGNKLARKVFTLNQPVGINTSRLMLKQNKKFAFKLYNYRFKLRKKMNFFNFSLFQTT